MKKNIIYTLCLAAFVVFFSCEKDDNTGASTLVVTNTEATITVPSEVIALTETDSTFEFSISISKPQISDVVFYISQIGGDATLGDDYDVLNANSKLTIPASFTTGKVKIKVKMDNVAEDVETLQLQIGDERTGNVKFTAATVNFSISNATKDILELDLSWETDVETSIGVVMKPTDVADMMLLIVDSNGDIVDGADGAAFEAYDALNTLPDGTYTIAAAIYYIMDAGDLNSRITIDLNLALFQVGVIDDAFDVPMTGDSPCDSYIVNLATVVKTGGTFTYEKAVYHPNEALTEIWYGTDEDYDSEIVSKIDDAGVLHMVGLNFGWMRDFWGEVIVDSSYLDLTVNWCDGSITIPKQECIKTTYNDKPQPAYSISGTGTFDVSGAYPVINITYKLWQGTTDIGKYLFGLGYMEDAVFNVDITLDPGVVPTTANIRKAIDLAKIKPVR